MAGGGIETLREGDELVRRIFDAVPGGVVYVSADGSIREANADGQRILGLRFDELTKRFVTDSEPVTIREDGSLFPIAEYPVAMVLTTGKPQPPVTIGVRARDGETSWAVFRAEPVQDPTGALAGAVVTFLDITERKRAEEALRRSEERWRQLAESFPDFVLIVDREGRVLSVNRVLDGITPAEVIGHPIWSWVPEPDRDAYLKAFGRALAGERVTFQTRGVGPSAATIWYETQLIPVLDGTGGVERIIAVARDVTDHRAMLASLAEKERLASVGMLAASVAHEIMNPLTYVLANLDFVASERNGDPERRAKALVEAREGARRMQQIVWDLRALGRAGGDELFYVDARSVLEIALRLSGPEVQRTASVVLELAEVPSVLASESRLCQVFINLLVNAAQAMETLPVERREIRVRTRHDEAANLVGIDVADNGDGIAPDRLLRIFEPFFTTKEKGTGLGLSICRDIVERMSGRIDVTSKLGIGTTFTVWLSTTRASR